VLWRAQKPNWLALSRPLSSICFWSILERLYRIAFLLWTEGWCKFCGSFGSLPGLGKVITFASFQGFGKCDSRMQWMNKWVRWTNGRLGRCLRYSFGMSSIPQAFLNFKEFIIFFNSHGLIFEGSCLRFRAVLEL
jgi:hypothetical protein